MSEKLPPNLKNAIMLCWAYNWRAMGTSFILGGIFAAMWGILARTGQFPAPLVDAGTNAIGIMVVTFSLIFFFRIFPEYFFFFEKSRSREVSTDASNLIVMF